MYLVIYYKLQVRTYVCLLFCIDTCAQICGIKNCVAVVGAYVRHKSLYLVCVWCCCAKEKKINV